MPDDPRYSLPEFDNPLSAWEIYHGLTPTPRCKACTGGGLKPACNGTGLPPLPNTPAPAEASR